MGWGDWGDWSDVPPFSWVWEEDAPSEYTCSGEDHGLADAKYYFRESGRELNISASGLLAYWAKARGSAWYDFDLRDYPSIQPGYPGYGSITFSDIVGLLSSMNVAGVDGMSIHIYAFVDDLTMNTRVGEEIVLSEAISDVDSILSLIDYVIEVLLPEYTEKNYDLHSVTYSVFIPHLYEHTYRVGYWAEVVAIGAGGTAAVSDFEFLDRKIRIDRFSIGQE